MKIKRFLIKTYEEIYGIPLILKCALTKMLYPKDTIILKGFFIFKKWKIANFNWGDDINYYFFNEFTGKKVVLLPDTKLAERLRLDNFLCIGSTIMSFDMKNTTVWGTGLLNDQMGFKIKSKPKEILAVRGPLTRQWLMNQGIDCPKVYGDPALLLPRFYKSNYKKRFKMGIIPHYIDVENPVVKKLSQFEAVTFIKISGYDDWHEFIDKINECEFIISSSLHGVIVSEAYNVPVIWVKFEGTDYVPGWDFKFNDFYESVNKGATDYLEIRDTTTINELCEIVMTWKSGEINTDRLLDVCPFKINVDTINNT